jgi:type IV pilus assembly protein PilA
MIKAINRSIAARHEEDEKGFTLIELLVVILIIGVLAAIAIPAFLNQRQGAWESQVESDLRNATIAAEQFAVDHNGSYAGLTTTVGAADNDDIFDYGFNPTTDVTVKVTSADASGFALTGGHSSITTDHWVYNSNDGKITKTAGAQP